MSDHYTREQLQAILAQGEWHHGSETPTLPLASQCLELMDEVERLRDDARWVPVGERLPDAPCFAVLACYVNEYGMTRQVRAEYVRRGELEANDDIVGDWCEYDEATDTYNCPEGWYEFNEGEDVHWEISGDVTHWRPLPEPPEQPATEGER